MSARPIRSTSSTAQDQGAVPQGLRLGKGKNWNFIHSTLFLDFLAGNQDYHCTPWGMPTRNIFGWQKPCYLLGEGYAKTFKELMETTDWDTTAPADTKNARTAWRIAATSRPPPKRRLRGLAGHQGGAVRCAHAGPMAPEIALDNQRPAQFVFSRHVEQEGRNPCGAQTLRRAAGSSRVAHPAPPLLGRRVQALYFGISALVQAVRSVVAQEARSPLGPVSLPVTLHKSILFFSTQKKESDPEHSPVPEAILR